MFEQNTISKTTFDVPEMKLFKLFIIGLACETSPAAKSKEKRMFSQAMIGLKKKCNGEEALCWSHFIFFLISNSVTTSSNLSKLLSAGLINKKNTNKLMIEILFV